jgi:nucleoside-diphosphate-sugar epimerase
MKILVTGGGGFLGQALCRNLVERGFDVAASIAATTRARRDRRRTTPGRPRRCDAVRAAATGVAAIFHNAAKAGAWGPYDDYFRANVLGTRNVLAACRAHGIARLVYTSTPSVTHRATHPVEGGTADTVPYGSGFKAPYATTKTDRRTGSARGQRRNARHHRVAPAPDLGPGRQPAAAAPGRTRARRPPAPRRQRREPDRHHVHRQCRAGARRCVPPPGARRGLRGRAYFISNGEPRPVREIVNALLGAVGAPPVTKHLPFRAAFAIGAVCEALVDGVAVARRAADHALPRRATEHHALVRHGPGDAGLRLRAGGVDRGRAAAPRRSQRALIESPGS